jgi:hypothetical protein
MSRRTTAPAGSRYQDQRHYVVAATLVELGGPTEGVVRLDSSLDWSGDPRYDLDDPGDLQVIVPDGPQRSRHRRGPSPLD